MVVYSNEMLQVVNLPEQATQNISLFPHQEPGSTLAKPIRAFNLENYPTRPNIFKTGFPQGFKVCLGIFFLNKVE